MSPKKKTAVATAEETATNTTPVVSDEELLKAKKVEAKEKKEHEKEEKKIAREAKKSAPTKAERMVQKRNPLKMHGKKYRKAAEKIDKNKLYSLVEAVKLARESATTKFDSSVEVHTRLGIDPKKSDQIVRSTVALPHGTGKQLRVVAFVSEDKAGAAKKAGAVDAGEDDLIEKISKGWLEFDVAVATPDVMKKLGKVAKTLGQKGLMPNPKAGTVTPDVISAIGEIQKGKVEFRGDAYGILHNIIGKASFGEDKLLENLKTYLRAVNDAKPKAVKGVYIKTLALTTSMGPSVRIDAGGALREI